MCTFMTYVQFDMQIWTCEYSICLSNSIYPEMASYPLNLHSFLCHISSKGHFNGKNGGNYNGKYKNKQDTTGDESKKKKKTNRTLIRLIDIPILSVD